MSRPLRSLAAVLLAAVGLIAIHEWGPQGLYSFHHHGALLFDLTRILLALLFVTHLSLCAIMWAQRRSWAAAEESIFRFVAVKAVFWAFAAATAVQRSGVNLASFYLIVLLLLSTFDLDVQLVRRYMMTERDGQISAEPNGNATPVATDLGA